VGGVEKSQNGETEIDQNEPDQQREQPQQQCGRGEAAQMEADAENIGTSDNGQEREDQARIEQV